MQTLSWVVPYFHGSSVSLCTAHNSCPLNSVFCAALFWRVAHPSLALVLILGSSPPSPSLQPPSGFSLYVNAEWGFACCQCHMGGWLSQQHLPIMVVPPARAAFDPWAKSSTVVVPRYGIWKWVWISMPPGITIFPLASMVLTPPGTIRLSPICLWGHDIIINVCNFTVNL